MFGSTGGHNCVTGIKQRELNKIIRFTTGTQVGGGGETS